MIYGSGKLTDEALLKRARDCFRLCTEAESRQREREREDLRFQVPELQWDDAARKAREGRPILSIPKLDQPVQIVLNQERQAKLGVNIHPVSPDADDDTAEVLQGLYREIERESQAPIARSWAFDRAVKCGRGAYRVNTRYDEEGGHPFDQVITIERILHQDSVYFDPAATKADYSDGNWAFSVGWMSLDDFARQYPKAKITGDSGAKDFEGLANEAPTWVRFDGPDKAILVAEYWWKDYQTETIVLLEDGVTVVPKGDMPAGAAAMLDKDGEPYEREREVILVHRTVMTGLEVLEDEEWNGKYIPLIPVIGKELQSFDSERRYVGIIGPAKDAQRLFNYSASQAVETAALEPKAPWIGAEGQFEGHEEKWKQSNTRNFPYLEYKPTTIADSPVPPPARTQIDGSRLGVSMQLLQVGDTFIQSATATFDPALGRQNSKERSGRAILAQVDQSEAGTSHYIANLADISMAYEAKVVLDLIPKIYDRPGRVARTLDLEDDTEQVVLNQPFYHPSDTDRPVALPAGMAPPTPPQGKAPEVKHYDLRKGVYAVSVSIGKSYQSKLDQGATEIGEILTARPELMPLLGPTYFRYRDFPAAEQIADILTKVRDHQMPWLNEDDQGAPTPEQAQAQIQGMQQQIQAMQQALQQQGQELATDKAKQEATIIKATADNATKEAIARMENATKLAIEQMRLEAQNAKMQHETVEGTADRMQEGELAKFQAKADIAKAAVDAALAPVDLNYSGSADQPLGGEGDQI